MIAPALVEEQLQKVLQVVCLVTYDRTKILEMPRNG